MAKKTEKKLYFAYYKDGTQVQFNHAVDYSQAMKAGLLPNPPGVVVEEKPAAPEGEKVSGITPIVSEKVEAPVVEHEEEAKQKKTKLHRA
jgi:hypothetical protein